jgi:RES domain-containing protein
VLETLVHVEPTSVPPDLTSYEIDVPERVWIETASYSSLPPDWHDTPGHPASRALGDAWLARGDTVALIVPSAVVPGERNVLINPHHHDARAITIVRALPFRFDLRLVRE